MKIELIIDGKPTPPRWKKHHELLGDVLQRFSSDVWTRNMPSRAYASYDRVTLMRQYVNFLADHNRDMARQIQAEIAAMSVAPNKRVRKALREKAWQLCVADATLRLPEAGR